MVMQYLGARVESSLIKKFKKICSEKGYKQQTIIKNLIEYWIEQEDGED